MSNKTLITILVVVLALIGGSLAFYSALQKGQGGEVAGMSQYAPVSPQVSGQQPSSTPASTQGQTMADCTRDFDQNKLANNGNINIANRQVTISVKNFGDITVELYDKDAPKTVTNFLRLADSGYYDCLTFHRVSKGFVIQGGDPNGDGTGGQSAFGKPFEDELNPNTQSYKTGYVKGVLAMANSGPNTNGSQFFILLADQTSWMPHNYTIFGKVVAGQDVVDKIGQVDITPNPQMGGEDGSPKVPVVMQSVKITK